MSINPADYASASALLRGAELHLRSAALFNDRPGEAVGRFIGRQPAPGKPPPNYPRLYIALHWAGGRGTDMNPQGHDVLHGIALTLTALIGDRPPDREGIKLTTAGDLYDLVDALAGPNVIHGSYELLAAANRLIPGTAEHLTANGGDPDNATVNGFIEPLVLDTFGPERPATAEWLGAKTAEGVYVVDLRFVQARRARLYEG